MPIELPRSRRGNTPNPLLWIGLAALLILVFGRSFSSWIVDYFWWREMGQVSTWFRMTAYRYLPPLGAWLIVFAVLWIAHNRGMRHANERLRDHRLYAWVSTLGIAFVAFILTVATVDGWTIARYAGSHAAPPAPDSFADPVFGKPLNFYFFDLPLYDLGLTWLAATTLLGALAYYLAARGWQLRRDFPHFGAGGELDLRDLRALGRLETGLFKGLLAVFLVALAADFWLGRYELLFTDHGNLMVGIDYVQQNVGLPLQTAKALFALLAAGLILAGQRKWAAACALILVVDWGLPPLVSALYVRPNELTLEKPYLERHIEATRSAYGLETRTRETEFPAHEGGRIDFARNRSLLDDVRLWDWRAFHDTLSQSQPLRPYTYADTDIDRYNIDGRLRQTLLAPRELDLNQLGDARNRWINRSLTFTHGYGLALAEANQISETGLPELLVKDAPVSVLTRSLKVTRPEIYYGETGADPVFVHTSQPEFNYPAQSGTAAASEVNTSYAGKGGFPMSTIGDRTIAAVAEGDWNILLTNALTAESRMMIHRPVMERLQELAPFLSWDADPYMVITDSGRLVWIVDGYLTSESHPYSRDVVMEGLGRFNYIRNSIKATVDAYDGEIRLYVFDPADPLIRAYRQLFPELFTDAGAMPADLRAHTRAPEMLFRAQAEIYRTYHMRDPESYYNRADLWDLATFTTGQGGQPEPVAPTYMMAELPGESQTEFVLLLPFTPRAKQNLIGLMVARCDGPHLGELVFLQLPKQEVIRGPLQVEALINQDQNISKDLTLWNQQGSQVLRSQVLTLPIDQTFLYVAPIYIQAAQARMPQLRKIALVDGNTLIYADTYREALAQLQAALQGQPISAETPPVTSSAAPAPATDLAPAGSSPRNDPRIEMVRMHLQRYRELSSQGKWAEAGKELEAIDSTVRK